MSKQSRSSDLVDVDNTNVSRRKQPSAGLLLVESLSALCRLQEQSDDSSEEEAAGVTESMF